MISILCSVCSELFTGCWRPRVERRDDEVNTQISGAGDNNEMEEQQTNRWLDDSTGDNGMGKVWTHGDSKYADDFSSMLHWSIPELEISAAKGCHTCIFLWDRLPTVYDGHQNFNRDIWQLAKEKSPRLVGLVTLQTQIDERRKEIMWFEVSYYLDADSTNPDFFFCCSELFLLPKEVDHSNERSEPSCGSTISLVTRWISDCRSNHPECEAAASFIPPRRPKRLIEMTRQVNDQPSIRLVDAQSLPADVQYATLSHCWGKTKMPKLDNNNESIYYQNIPWAVLTTTFQDAVIYTDSLDIRYIWIDAFCINQENFVDWLDEALSMASIFSNAHFNVAATSSPDGDGGLFLAKNKLLAENCYVEASWTGLPGGLYCIFDDTVWRRRIDDAVLNHRAWVVQERLLSPRTVHFGYDQVSWECGKIRCSESWPDGVPSEHFSIRTEALHALKSMRHAHHGTQANNENWLALMMRYSECFLTESSDKLVALAGLAESACGLMGYQPSDYMAGLWRPYLLQDLMWHVQSASEAERYTTYHAPTWSWASINGAVRWNSSGAHTAYPAEFACRILATNVEHVDKSRLFGPILSAWIELAAPLYPMELCPSRDEDTGRTWYEVSIRNRRFTQGLELDDKHLLQAIANWIPEAHPLYFCRFATVPAMVPSLEWSSDGLILEKGVDGGQVGFRRCGWARLFHDEAEEEFDAFGMAGSSNGLGGDLDLRQAEDGKYILRLI